LADVLVEDRLDVDDRRPIQRFEATYPHSVALDRGDLYLVQADGIRAVRRAGTEHTFYCPGSVPSRVHAQHISTGAIEPSEEEDLVTGLETLKTFQHLRLKN
jgi:hypothetical protein